MSDSTEYLGAADRGDDPGDDLDADTREPRRFLLSLEQWFRVVVVCLLLVTAAASTASYLIAREQKSESDQLNCLYVGTGFGDGDGTLSDDERNLTELWDCDLDGLGVTP